MKKISIFLLSVYVCILFNGIVSARDVNRNSKRIRKDMNGTDLLTDDSVPGFYEAAAIDTYNIVRYSFEVNNTMGWITVDQTAQYDIFYHVDNFGGLSGGDYSLLVPISGTQSMWCGTRPGNDTYLCSWETAPGYGNNWNQHFESNIITLSSTVQLDYHAVTHCECSGHDETNVDYLNNSDEWVRLRTFSGYVDTADVITLTVEETGTSTRFRFHFVSDGAWSDQDGLLNTDGAVILDNITVTADAVVLDTEDFESATVGDHSTTFWTGFSEPPYGSHAGIMTGLTEPDPCHNEYGTQWTFLDGSVEQANQIFYPGMYVTPRCLNSSGAEAPCQNEGIISPMIDMTRYSTTNNNIQDGTISPADQGLFGKVIFRYQVYRDLPLDNLIFYTWRVRNIINGCPGVWKDRNYFYYGPDKDYLFTGQIVSDLVSSPNDTLQINLGVLDICDAWGGIVGTCANHTPSPWFDNVYVQRTKQQVGPQWSFRSLDLFQDNFPPAEDQNGFVRADAANDIAAPDNLNQIIPGDSIVVTIASPATGGIKKVNNLPAVYMHVKVTPSDYAFADLAGDVTNSDCNYVSDNGTWTIIQGDTAQSGNPTSIVKDKYAFDLNDALFTYGHVIEYYFSAIDNSNETSYLPTNAQNGGIFEWTCLPSNPTVKRILYVDDYDHIGSWDGKAQNYLEPALEAIVPKTWDRYDISSPSSMAGNGLESRINAANLGLFYDTIIWDSGDLNTGTITNNTPASGKCNDVTLLQNWAEDQTNHGHKTNMLIMGDGIVEDLYNAGSVSFLNNVLHVNLADQSYFDITGGIGGGGYISPLVTPTPGSAFDGLENFYVFGGCPVINHFDVLDTTTIAKFGLMYPDHDGISHYAAIYSDDKTSNNYSKRIVTTGFSFMCIRDTDSHGPPARIELLDKIFEFFENGIDPLAIEEPDTISDPPTPVIVPYKLCQNYPNPFNPGTTIEYTMKEKGYVSICIYDIAGRLVRTLVDGTKDNGLNREEWKGINNNGTAVASGVYFYKMKAGKYRETKKMILLR